MSLILVKCKDSYKYKYEGKYYARMIKNENKIYYDNINFHLESLIKKKIILTKREELNNKLYDNFVIEFRNKMKDKGFISSDVLN